MKIQSLSINYNSKSFFINKQNNTSVKELSKNESFCVSTKQSIPQYCYIAYLPNFTSKKARSSSSDKVELYEKSGDFKLAQYCDISCPACGKKMLNIEKFNKIQEELSSAKTEEYLEILNKYKDYMRPVEESVFNEIYELSNQPGESKDIRTLLVGLRDKKLPILQKVQMRQVKKMKSLAKTLPQNERMVLEGKIQRLKHHIRKTNAEAPFRRKILLDRISKIKIKNPKQYEKLQNIAKNFPTSADMNSAWIVKYSGKHGQNQDWTSFEIAQRFLSSSIANTDHILAYSLEKNHDDISNYLAMHSACNSQKGDKSFLQWIHEDKYNRIRFLNKYFKEAEKITKDLITDKKYNSYSTLAKETIYQTTNGSIDLRKN